MLHSIAAVVLAVTAAPALLVAMPGTAAAAPTSNRAEAAAGWLGRQLDTDTHLVQGQFGADYGLTADVVLALDAAGVGRSAGRAATRALAAHVLDYTGGGDATEHYAGSWAKMLVVATAQGRDPSAFGSGPRRNLVRGLSALECGTATRTECPATDDGRFADRSQYGNFSNTFSQSLALIGLERATSRGASAAAVRFLLDQQCDNGGYPETFGEPTCTPTVDATGFAVQALTAVGTGKASAAAVDAGGWLRRAQHGNGSFSGNGVRNANSTALGAQALTALGGVPNDRAATAARGFLRRLQVLCGGTPGNRGQVRYDRAGSGDPVRATSQAVPALAQVALAEVGSAGAIRSLPRLGC